MKSLQAITVLIIVNAGAGLNAGVGDGMIRHGIEVRVVGPPREQGVQIIRNGKTICEKMMRDGNVSKVLSQKASDDDTRYNVAVRYGTDADLWIAFAVIGDNVIESPVYRNTAKGDNNIPATWTSRDHLGIEIGGKQPNEFVFNPTLKEWTRAQPNSPPSTKGGIKFYPDPGPDGWTGFTRPTSTTTTTSQGRAREAGVPGKTRTVEIHNEMDEGVSFVVQSDAINVTPFSQSGSVGGKARTTIQVPEDVNTVKYMLTRSNENTGWVHASFLGMRPNEHLDFTTGYTWRSN
jgi:hypothetical protein